MQKKIQKKSKALVVQVPLPGINKSKGFSFYDFRFQSFVLAAIGLLFYANSFTNQYAFDDGIVILKNEYVQQGFSGIGKILTRDAYDSFYRQRNAAQQFSGGRYRPLSAVTFAIEQQLFGSKEKDKPDDDVAMVRHVVNVLLYIFSVIVMLYFLTRFIFKKNPLTAFIASLLFLIHPLHTEVIANVKSRDEILSFLFIILTFIYVLKYSESKKIAQLLYGLLFYFLALLSKEYAVSLIVLIPMLLYIVKRCSLQNSLIATLPFLLVAVAYLAMRFSFVGVGNPNENPDVLNNPYKFATAPEKLATKIEVLLMYLKLLFYPHPLTYDYSYNTYPYVNFGNGLVWTSILVHVSMIAAAIVLFFKRNILSFALAFYIIHLFLVSNFVLDVGATMGERLAYHSSFGFVIIVAVFLERIFSVSPAVKNISLLGIGTLITIWCGAKVIKRNTEWKNDIVLYTTDVDKVPNSALSNGNAGMALYNLSQLPENKARENEMIQEAIVHLDKSVAIHKDYVNGYLNLGVAYLRLKDYDKAKYYWDIVKVIYPNNPILKANYDALAANYYNEAMTIGQKDPEKAITFLEKATEVAPDNPTYWYNLGGACFTARDYEKARMAWTKTLELDPDNKDAKNGMAALPPTVVK